MSLTVRVRLGLVAVASVLAVLVSFQPSRSQPFPPGGFPGRPPGMPNLPSPPTPPGMPGGIAGRPGFSGIGGAPNFPQPPSPPGLGIGGGHGIRGGGGGGIDTVWKCGRCGMVLAHGPVPPPQVVCPRCQTTNVPPGTPIGPGSGLPGPGPANPPPSVPAVPENPPENPQLPDAPKPPAPNWQPAPGRPAMDNATVHVPPDDRTTARTTAYAIAITLGILMLLGVGAGAVVFTILRDNKRHSELDRRPRRRRRYDDDY